MLTAEEVAEADEVAAHRAAGHRRGRAGPRGGVAERARRSRPWSSRSGSTPRTEYDDTRRGRGATDDEDDEPAEPYSSTCPCGSSPTSTRSGLRRRGPTHRRHQARASDDRPRARRQAEARREERRRVIANNKAWASAETVRREWLAGFLARKTAPKGAEALICEAVVTGQHYARQGHGRRPPDAARRCSAIDATSRGVRRAASEAAKHRRPRPARRRPRP